MLGPELQFPTPAIFVEVAPRQAQRFPFRTRHRPGVEYGYPVLQGKVGEIVPVVIRRRGVTEVIHPEQGGGLPAYRKFSADVRVGLPP